MSEGDTATGETDWFVDPYGLPEARWYSAGSPTALIRDGEIEGHDEPPAAPAPTLLKRFSTEAENSGGDLKRADDGSRESRSSFELALDVTTATFNIN